MNFNYNRSVLGGRLTDDPKSLGDGKGCSFTVASNRVYKDRDGEKVEDTVFMRCVVWSKLSDLVMRMCERGTTVLVEGRLETRRYEGKDGETREFINLIGSDVRFIDGLREKEDSSSYSSDREPHKDLSVKGMRVPPGTNQATVDALNVLLNPDE